LLATGCMIQNDLAPSHSSARGVLSLCRKMGLLPDMPIEFFCRGAPLESSSTLDLIARTVWKDQASDLVLHYHVA